MDFPLCIREKSIGAGVFGAFRQTEQTAALGEGNLPFFLEGSFPSWWLCLSPPTWGGEVTLTSNKDHSVQLV